jgi:hypothetical protein
MREWAVRPALRVGAHMATMVRLHVPYAAKAERLLPAQDSATPLRYSAMPATLWCSALPKPEDAEAFAKRFGGERLATER